VEESCTTISDFHSNFVDIYSWLLLAGGVIYQKLHQHSGCCRRFNATTLRAQKAERFC
jgi:hypothetical protein